MIGSGEIPRNPPTLPTFGEHAISYATVAVAEFQLETCQMDLCVCVCICIFIWQFLSVIFGWLNFRVGRCGKMLPVGTTTKGRE